MLLELGARRNYCKSYDVWCFGCTSLYGLIRYGQQLKSASPKLINLKIKLSFYSCLQFMERLKLTYSGTKHYHLFQFNPVWEFSTILFCNLFLSIAVVQLSIVFVCKTNLNLNVPTSKLSLLLNVFICWTSVRLVRILSARNRYFFDVIDCAFRSIQCPPFVCYLRFHYKKIGLLTLPQNGVGPKRLCAYTSLAHAVLRTPVPSFGRRSHGRGICMLRDTRSAACVWTVDGGNISLPAQTHIRAVPSAVHI